MKAIDVPRHTCNCGYSTNMTSPAFDETAVPEEGDATLCLRCGHLWIFNRDLTQREPTDEDMKDFRNNPERYKELMLAQNAILRRK